MERILRVKEIGKNFILNRLLLCAFAGNFILCIIGLFIVPAVVSASDKHMDWQRPLLFLTALFLMIIAVLFLSALGYSAERSLGIKMISFRFQLVRTLKFAVVIICFMPIYFIACGVLSVILYAALKSMLTYENIKLLIDIITSISTILLTPVILLELISFSLSKLSVRRAIRAGFTGIRYGYIKVFAVVAAVFLVGEATSYIPGLYGNGMGIVAVLLKVIIYTLISGSGTYIIYRTGINIYAERGRRQ